MSVIYRSLWTDHLAGPQEEFLAACLNAFKSWALEDDDASLEPDSPVELVASQGRHRTVTLRTLTETDDLSGFEAVACDIPEGQSTAWTTSLKVVCEGSDALVLVENAVESEDPTIRVKVGRPRLVDDLLAVANKPALGGSGVTRGEVAVSAHEIPVLLELLRSETRTLPVIVATQPGGSTDDTWRSVPKKIASRVNGVATVVSLDNDAVTALKRELGELAIWGGGVRVYAPVPVTDDSEGWRHRYTPGARMAQAEGAMIDRIVYGVAQLSSRRRVPAQFSAFDAVVSPTTVEVSTDEFEAQRDAWERALDEEISGRNAVEKEFAHATGHLARLKEALLRENLGHLLWGTEHETLNEAPDEVQDVSEACTAAQVYLDDWLSLPNEAIRHLEGIDSAPNSYAWGQTAWRGLRALAAYAKDCADGWSGGTFRDWCLEGRPLAWPVTTKKLSMSESDTVQNNKKLREARLFKVSTEVDPDGEILMYAHLKIAEGGGNLAPRIYFHDDTTGKSGKIHIGLVGPHYLVPNGQTN